MKNMYDWRLELFRSLWCKVDGEARVWRIEIREWIQWILLLDCDILGDYIDHLRVKNKQPVGKGDKVKLQWKVYMYCRNMKVWLTEVLLSY